MLQLKVLEIFSIRSKSIRSFRLKQQLSNQRHNN